MCAAHTGGFDHDMCGSAPSKPRYKASSGVSAFAVDRCRGLWFTAMELLSKMETPQPPSYLQGCAATIKQPATMSTEYILI